MSQSLQAGERALQQSVTTAGTSQSKRSQALLSAVGATLHQSSFQPAAVAFCLQFVSALGALRATLARVAGDELKIVALSHGSPDGLDRKTTELLLGAMNECRDQSMTIVVPDVERRARAIDANTRRLRQLTQGRVLSIPIGQDGRVAAVVTIEIEPSRLADADVAEAVRLCEDMVVLTAPYLLALQRDERGAFERLRDRVRRAASARASHRLRPWHAAAGALVLAVAVLALVPMAVTIGAPARVEGSVQRVIAAPVDGFIKSVAVRPGDAVKQGQVVAELIDRDLQLERSKYQGEIAQHENAYAAAMARAERADMVIHQARLAEARAQASLIEQQLARIQMRAPIDGVILHGDLSQMIGAPVDKGQVLMTAAPTGEHRIIIELDERDIGRVRPGQRGRLSVSALPWAWMPLQVRRITPMAQVLDARNVFEVEAVVEGGPAETAELRAGLRGVVRLHVDDAPPLGVWLRRLADHLHRFAWRWLP